MTAIASVNQSTAAPSSQEPLIQEAEEQNAPVYLAASPAYYALLAGTASATAAAAPTPSKKEPKPVSLLIRGFQINHERKNVAAILENFIVHRIAYLWDGLDVISKENIGTKLPPDKQAKMVQECLNTKNCYDKFAEVVDADFSITGNIEFSTDLDLDGTDEFYDITLELSNRDGKVVATKTYQIKKSQMDKLVVLTDKALAELIKAMNGTAKDVIVRHAVADTPYKDDKTNFLLRFFWKVLEKITALPAENGKRPDPDSLQLDFDLPDLPPAQVAAKPQTVDLDLPLDPDFLPPPSSTAPAPVVATDPSKIDLVFDHPKEAPKPEPKAPTAKAPSPAAPVLPALKPVPPLPQDSTPPYNLMMWGSGLLALGSAVISAIGRFQAGQNTDAYNQKVDALVRSGVIAGTPGDFHYTSFDAKAQHESELKSEAEKVASSNTMATAGLAGAVVMTGLTGLFYKLQSVDNKPAPAKVELNLLPNGTVLAFEFQF